ncbi:MAG: trypsin-like peptidase domain-containing protein [Caldilineaceae bacterium]
MANQLNNWKNIIWPIRNDWGGWGTGFLVKKESNLANGTIGIRFFLVTNKHVVGEDPKDRRQREEITVFVRINTDKSKSSRKRAVIPMVDTIGTRTWKEHPDNNVDVLAVDVSPLIFQNMQIAHDALTQASFVNDQFIDDFQIITGDDVVVIGYPDFDGDRTIEPIITAGTLATRIGEPLIEYIAESNLKSTRGFLINHVTVPGSSGSPVILKPTVGRTVRGKNYLGLEVPPLLLGIVAQTRHAKVKASVFEGRAFAGIGLAFDAVAIQETIDLFFD